MTRLRVTTDTLSPKLNKLAAGLSGSARRPLLMAMAKEFAWISKRNFGKSGVDRPAPWRSLTKNYASWKKRYYGRSTADLILEGKLRASIRASCDNDQFAVVSADTPYARAHQFGHGPLPPRPFMPFFGTKLTPYAQQRMLEALAKELRKLLR